MFGAVSCRPLVSIAECSIVHSLYALVPHDIVVLGDIMMVCADAFSLLSTSGNADWL